MDSLKFNTPSVIDGILLISGAGDGDTGGGLCALDAGMIETVDRASTAGITIFEGRLARLLRTPLSTEGGEILIYDHRGISRYLRVDELSDPHYMAWDGDHLVVASTGSNSIVWVSLGGEVLRCWRAPGDRDSWHLNDVCLVDKHLYACAFGRFDHYREYKEHLADGSGIVFDVATGRCVVAGLCAPHSPRFFDGAWTVCDSLRDSVVQVDSAGCKRKEAQLRSFTRGMAVTDEYLIVGESALREAKDGQSTGSVAVLRRSDFSFVNRFTVPFREVGEIVVAPRSMIEAVRVGFRTNPLRVSESDQLQMFRALGMEPKRMWAVSERLSPGQCKVQIDTSIPATLVAGTTALVKCTVQNLSDAFLCSELPWPVNISYRWRGIDESNCEVRQEGARIRLPRMLSPGDCLHLNLDITAPDVPGEYEVVVTMVQEFVAWFDDIDPSNGCSAAVRVVCPDSPEPPSSHATY